MTGSVLDLTALRDAPFDAVLLSERLGPFIDELTFGPERKRFMRHATGSLIAMLDATPGVTLQERWARVEAERWPRWDAGLDRPWPAKNWTWGPAALVLSRAICPGWLPAAAGTCVAVARLASGRPSAACAAGGPQAPRRDGRVVGRVRAAAPRGAARTATAARRRLSLDRRDHR